MLRIHFSELDLARTRVTAQPDPMWEIASSLHRFQTRRGRWAHERWHKHALHSLRDTALGRTVRTLLMPLYPRAQYFPDFLTPGEGADSLDAGLDAILALPESQVTQEISRLDLRKGNGPMLRALAEPRERRVLTETLRAYHQVVIEPVASEMQALLDGERAVRSRHLLDGGVDGLLRGLGPAFRWQPPVLSVLDHIDDRDVHLGGRGLRLVPSYFCWHQPVTFADPSLPQVLVYPLPRTAADHVAAYPERALAALIGGSRALVLAACAAGATTSEIARRLGISAATVSYHTRTLREAGLISSRRDTDSVMHSVTQLGIELMRQTR
ncbi:helix-turn-helix transcriptional regulator [Mumia sp. ZJ1417]|uniref:ArsR/SmtB family transcription factor n=1 Tax=Mumia sp. ZJ1417 TaxID=2708082 RepID=UPI00141F7888|nr:helix-turn-helix domain-containing protein [Mumia sp. ZJ1417]QMW65317.1 helix-turn-helix transcriptional regulator [Mumia sp. ZJ1417]